MVHLWILLILGFSFVVCDSCLKFKCMGEKNENNNCATINENEVQIWNCETGHTCNVSNLEGNRITRVCEKINTVKYPGDIYNDGDDCKGYPMSGFCRGKYLGEECNSTIECDVDLRCGIKGICEWAGDEGNYCDKIFLCKSYLTCEDNGCVKYGSIPNTYKPSKLDYNKCEHHFIEKGKCDYSITYTGTDIYVDKNTKCTYNNTVQTNSQCSFHKDGKAICVPGAEVNKTAWNDLLIYLDSKPRCNPLTYMAQCDFGRYAGTTKYLRGRIAYTNITYFAEVQENADCVKEYNMREYFMFLKELKKANGRLLQWQLLLFC